MISYRPELRRHRRVSSARVEFGLPTPAAQSPLSYLSWRATDIASERRPSLARLEATGHPSPGPCHVPTWVCTCADAVLQHARCVNLHPPPHTLRPLAVAAPSQRTPPRQGIPSATADAIQTQTSGKRRLRSVRAAGTWKRLENHRACSFSVLLLSQPGRHLTQEGPSCSPFTSTSRRNQEKVTSSDDHAKRWPTRLIYPLSKKISGFAINHPPF